MIADIIACIILAWCIIAGIRRGFAEEAFKLAAMALSIWGAVTFYNPFMSFIKSVPPLANGVNALEHFIAILILPALGKGDVSIPKVLSGIITPTMVTQTKQEIALAIAGVIASVVIMLIFIVVIKLIIFLISKCLKIVTKLPVIKQANKLLGGVLGFAVGICMCYIASLVIFLLQSCYAPFVDAIMANSFLMSYFSSTNALIHILI